MSTQLPLDLRLRDGSSFANFTASGNSEARLNVTSKLLQVDTNGDGTVDMNVTLTGVSAAAVSNSNFLWS